MATEILMLPNAILDPERVVALAEAVVVNREPQAPEVDSVRARARQMIRRDSLLEGLYQRAVASLVGSCPELTGSEWPYFQAREAVLDAIVGTLLGDRILRLEWEVLTWPWSSVCGPVTLTRRSPSIPVSGGGEHPEWVTGRIEPHRDMGLRLAVGE